VHCQVKEAAWDLRAAGWPGRISQDKVPLSPRMIRPVLAAELGEQRPAQASR